MKSTSQTETNAKAEILKGVRSVKRKTSSTAKRTSRAAHKLADNAQSTLSGYSESAQRLIDRSRTAFGDASIWAGKTLPRTARDLGVPNQHAVQTFMSEKPLIVGAVGLGLGVVLGAMLPAFGLTTKPARRR